MNKPNPTGRFDLLLMRLSDRIAPAHTTPEEYNAIRPLIAQAAAAFAPQASRTMRTITHAMRVAAAARKEPV